MEGGYFRIGRFGGAPVRIHWSAPIGAFAFCGFGFFPGAWAAFLLLILIHELGHAIMVRSFGLHVVSVDVHGLGGYFSQNGGLRPSPELAQYRVPGCERLYLVGPFMHPGGSVFGAGRNTVMNVFDDLGLDFDKVSAAPVK